LAELPGLTSFFFEEPASGDVSELYANPVDKQLKGVGTPLIADMLRSSMKTLEDSNFGRDDVAKRLNELLRQLQTKPGILFAAIRIAVTGTKSSPGLFGTISVLGKEKVSKRLFEALTILEK